MRKYRLVLLLKRGLKKEDKDKILSNVKKWVGKVEKESLKELGEKKLAYSIRKEKSGEYLFMDFEAENIAAGLDKKILMQEDVLRHL